MLECLARFEIEAFERARAVAAPRSPEAAALDLRREEALQTTLRQAIFLGDREVAQDPLHHVAAHLGIEFDEGDEDWNALAYEATKLLLDVSQERTRRLQGFYDQPTPYFRRAVNTIEPAAVQDSKVPAQITVAPATFASDETITSPAATFGPTATTLVADKRTTPSHAPVTAVVQSEPEPIHVTALQDERPAAPSSRGTSTSLLPAIVPGRVRPSGRLR